jgi:hypothetical protein
VLAQLLSGQQSLFTAPRRAPSFEELCPPPAETEQLEVEVDANAAVIVPLLAPAADAKPREAVNFASGTSVAQREITLVVGDRVEHPSRGSATITAADARALTAVFDQDPGRLDDIHTRLARLRPIR